ncbi:MAG: GAF domain-containing protein [Candidatus Levybacteria bacterium]|nr:GAF domain-containing protein [Candidatus Levybacteria bacterium]
MENLSLIIFLLATLIFGSTAILLSFREEKTRKLLKEHEQSQKQKLYETEILREIQDRIGYELDVEKIIDVITGSLRNFFAYSTASSLLIKDERLVFKAYVEEKVSRVFIEQVKKAMLASLSAILEKPPTLPVDESISGVVLDDQNTLPPASFFHIPLIVNDKVVGLINISSQKPGLYKESEMTILYQITSQAASALSKLSQVLTTEKGKLMGAIQSLADGVFMVDVNSQLLIINQATKTFLGIEKGEPTTLDVLSALSGSYNISAKIAEVISQRKEISEKEVALKDRTVQLFITPVIDTTADKVIGASVLLHDISLEKRLAQLKEEFTNMVVHELRAPLTSIKGASELLMEPENATDQAKLLAIIHDQSKKLLEQVSSLLDAAKLEAGKFTIQKSSTDLKELIAEKVESFMPLAKTKGVELIGKIDEDLPNTGIDAVRIGQVLNNLLSNSLKFTPEGGRITVKVSQVPQGETRDIRGTLDTRDTLITVSVSDTGLGIPKEKQGELFSKFSQIAHKEEGSTGLGLYISKGIVEAHGGAIWLKSEVDRGTTVSFTLPASPALGVASRGEPISEHQSIAPAEHTVSDEPIPLSPTLHTVVN